MKDSNEFDLFVNASDSIKANKYRYKDNDDNPLDVF